MAIAHRLSKVAKELGVGVNTITDFLNENGVECDGRPTAKIDESAYNLLLEQYSTDKKAKEKSKELANNREERVTITIDDQKDSPKEERFEDVDEIVITNTQVKPVVDLPPLPEPEKKEIKEEVEEVKAEEEKPEDSDGPKVLGQIDLSTIDTRTRPTKKKKEEPKKKVEPKKEEPKPEAKELKKEEPKPKEEKKEVTPEKPERIETKVEKLAGPKHTGQVIDLSKFQKPKKAKPVASSNDTKDTESGKKKRRKRIQVGGANVIQSQKHRKDTRGPKGRGRRNEPPAEVSQEDIQKEIKETLARLSGGGGKSKSSKFRKAKRRFCYFTSFF